MIDKSAHGVQFVCYISILFFENGYKQLTIRQCFHENINLIGFIKYITLITI